MTYRDIIKNLKAGKYEPVYLLHGDESYYIDQITDHIEHHILDESQKAFNLTILYGKDADQKKVIDEARRFPMMSDRQIVILREAQSMKGLTELKSYVENPLESTILVICHKHKKLDGRTAFAKAVKKHALVFESRKPYDNQMPAWINDYLSNMGYKIRDKESALIAEYLGNDLSKVANELDKMAVNLEKGHTITQDDIQDQIGISKDYNVFELQNALASRNYAKTYRIVHYFQSNPRNNPMVMVVATLFSFFSKIYLMHFLRHATDREVQKTLGLGSPYFIKEYRKAAQSYSKNQTERIIHLLKDFDLKSKGVDRVNVTEQALLQEMMYRILSV